MPDKKKKPRVRGRRSFAKKVLGQAQKRCKGKKGDAYRACVRREINKLKREVTTRKKKPKSRAKGRKRAKKKAKRKTGR